MVVALLGTADRAEAISLQQLLDGASISALDKDFTGWRLSFNEGAGADLSRIDVTPLEDDPLRPGLLFTAADGALAGIGATTRLQFAYSVTSNGSAIKDNELDLLDFVFTKEGGASGPANIIQLGETIWDANINFLGISLVFVLPESERLSAFEDFEPTQSLFVVTEFELDGGQFGIAQVNQFSQRFSQVPAISNLCPCERAAGDEWRNHGAYVSCVAHAANDFAATGLITQTEKGDIVSEAAMSNCGRKDQ
jgi:hypothetical protein